MSFSVPVPSDKTVEDLVRVYRRDEPVYVTRPTLPDLNEFHEHLRGVWERGWLTNGGPLHERLEQNLSRYLGVDHLSLFCNGTIALLVALQAMRINNGEVITTPFTFPATTHVLHWNRLRPVFCDIEPATFNLDPRQIEALITPETRAILPVHVYGNPCQVEAIREIADRHGLSVIYDASHAFGVKYRGQSLLGWGDMSTLSFHATKLYSTVEGGAIVAATAVQKKRIDLLKNFGIADEESVIGPGINGKLNEIQAAYGLLMLDKMADEIANRRRLAQTYREGLKAVRGVTFLEDQPGVEHNYGYFPIVVDPEVYGLGRDRVYDILKQCNIFTRKYFHPLCSHYSCYSGLPSAHPRNLPVAESVARQVLCLPMSGSYDPEIAQRTCAIIGKIPDIPSA